MSTIFGSDIVLAITQSAIRNQLQTLYDTALGPKLVSKLDASSIATGAKPKQHYLIDHNLKVSLKKPSDHDSVLDTYHVPEYPFRVGR
jgi:hypothetical protein